MKIGKRAGSAQRRNAPQMGVLQRSQPDWVPTGYLNTADSHRPEITLYHYSGTYNPKGSSFGRVQNGEAKNHHDLDISAPTGTHIQACLNETVVTVNQNDGNWGT